MPQTEEHLQILLYLGVPKIVVALTKCDLAKDIEAAEKEVRKQLRDTPFADAAIVKTAAPTSRGVAELRKQLAQEFASFSPNVTSTNRDCMSIAHSRCVASVRW